MKGLRQDHVIIDSDQKLHCCGISSVIGSGENVEKGNLSWRSAISRTKLGVVLRGLFRKEVFSRKRFLHAEQVAPNVPSVNQLIDAVPSLRPINSTRGDSSREGCIIQRQAQGDRRAILSGGVGIEALNLNFGIDNSVVVVEQGVRVTSIRLMTSAGIVRVKDRVCAERVNGTSGSRSVEVEPIDIPHGDTFVLRAGHRQSGGWTIFSGEALVKNFSGGFDCT